jgi:hypothetical protein
MRTIPIVMLLALAACSSEPAALPTPSPTPSSSVLGVTYGSPAIAEITTVQACTLVSVGEIEQATGVAASAPVVPGTAEALPACVWTLGDTEGGLVLSVAQAAQYETSPLGIEEIDIGDEAQWVPGDEDDAGELRVLVAVRDRSFSLIFAGGVVFNPRAAARALALRIVPRV